MKKTATLFKATGEVVEVTPENGRDFKLAELYKLLECDIIQTVEVYDDSGDILILDEEGKLKGEPVPNEKATEVYRKNRMSHSEFMELCKKKKYEGFVHIMDDPTEQPDTLFGNVIRCNAKMFR